VDLDVVFLGTAGSVPSAQRSPSATLLRRGGDRILVDCGEGTQRQLLRSSVGLVDLDLILLTHFHGDHVFGLPGLLKTYALRDRERPLPIVGPRGLGDLYRVLQPLIGRLPFELSLVELEPGEHVGLDGYRLEAHRASHRIAAQAYALAEEGRPGRFDVATARALGVPEGPAFGLLQRGEPVVLPSGETIRPEQVVGEGRRGRRVVLSGDTRPCKGVLEAAEGADVLVHEASFTVADAERARDTAHSTAREAAEVGKRAGVVLLALTHLGQRAHPREAKREARAVFASTVVPRDFDIIEVPFPERGRPELRRGAAAGDVVRREGAAAPSAADDEAKEDTP
jgi:ribonuclease Z